MTGGLPAALPKAELHVHLEGSMRPALLLELARRHSISLPADDVDGLQRWFRFDDFEHFVEIYLACSKCLRDGDDFARLMDDFVEQQAAQNVVYSEVHFTISTHLTNGVSGREIARALGAAIDRGEARGVRVRLIPDIVRNIGPRHADRTVEWALGDGAPLSVALGLAGIEGHPVAPFASHFAAAREAGLGTTAHAGEQLGAEAMIEVLDTCRPDRIGHGIRAVDDAGLLGRLVADGVPLEVCPTSNVCLGYAPSFEEHPIDRLLEAGAAVTVGSDDPPLFGTTLEREYRRLADAFGYGRERLVPLARAGFEHAFLPADERQRYLNAFDRAATSFEPRAGAGVD